MGRHPTYNRKYEIQHMWDRHHEIVRMTLIGESPETIANRLGITTQTVSNTLNSRMVQDKLAILRAERDASSVDVAKAIRELAPKAITVMATLLDENNEMGVSHSVRLRAAQDMLDRNGHAAPKVIEAKHMHGVFSREDLEEIKAKGQALALESGMIVEDAEVVND